MCVLCSPVRTDARGVLCEACLCICAGMQLIADTQRCRADAYDNGEGRSPEPGITDDEFQVCTPPR